MGPYWVINALAARDQVCKVVNIASAAHRVPMRCSALYCASKAALVHMTKVMARELAPKGWVINSVSPGMIPETRMSEMTRNQVAELRGWDPKTAEQYAFSLIPMGRYSSRIEITNAVYGMLSMPEYVNGTNLDIMGGV
jgi:NAD(P)-dependent dehydrogenase (short-subunit alcohol dehydrogenase family)